MTPQWFLGVSMLLLSAACVNGFLPLTERLAASPQQQQRRRRLAPSSNWSPVALSSTMSSYLLPGIEAIQQHNAELLEKLEALKKSNYFRLYSVDILASCEYMPQELFECYTESCEIYPVEEDVVPPCIKERDRDCGFELDGFGRWDMPTDDYYDIVEFGEGYTGYDGADVWNFIHNRICFEGYSYEDDHWKADYNKAVSGLHSMVSAQIIRGIQEKVDAEEEFTPEEKWTNPAMEFNRRLSPAGETPQAIDNLYFLMMLLLRAVKESKERILDDQRAGCMNDLDSQTLLSLYDSALLSNESAGKVSMASQKLHDHATKDKDSVEALWEARMRTRDLVRIMNCVQCNKCRLHGKIATMGVSTALQILVGWTGEGKDPRQVHRVEIATLLTTLHKCSRAIELCLKMQ